VFDQQELEDCKTPEQRFLVCKQKHPLLSTHFQETCPIKILQSRKDLPDSCNFHLVEINAIWVPLWNNQWIYSVPTGNNVAILCPHQETTDISLQGIWRLAIRAGCKGYSPSGFLQPNNIITVRKNRERGDLLLKSSPPNVCCAEHHFNLNSSNFFDVQFKQAASQYEDFKC